MNMRVANTVCDCSSLQKVAVVLAHMLVLVVGWTESGATQSALPTSALETVYYELPRDQEALQQLLGSEDAAAIVVRGTFNATESVQFSVRTSNRQIGMQVTRWSNPDCMGQLVYSDMPLDGVQADDHCMHSVRDFAPFSTRSHLNVLLRGDGARERGHTRFSFELAFTFYRTYTTSCDALRCSASRWCIASSLLCDGVPNCEDGSDEWASVCRERITRTPSAAPQTSTNFLEEYGLLLGAATLALLLVVVAVAIGLCCRRRRRAREARRAAQLASIYGVGVRVDSDGSVQPFLGPPAYGSAVRSGKQSQTEAAPPSYVEAVKGAKGDEVRAARPSSVELPSGDAYSDGPSTCSSCLDLESPGVRRPYAALRAACAPSDSDSDGDSDCSPV